MANKKRKWSLLSVVLLVLILTACNRDTGKSEPYSEVVEVNGQTLTITLEKDNLSAGTIASENGTYTFEYDASGTNVAFTVTYPDGCVFTQTEFNGGFATPAEYDSVERTSKGYIDLLSLNWSIEGVIDNARGTYSSGSPSILLALALISIGAWNLFGARSAWWLSHGWRYKNAEPSDLALMLYRITGIILIFVGIMCSIASF